MQPSSMGYLGALSQSHAGGKELSIALGTLCGIHFHTESVHDSNIKASLNMSSITLTITVSIIWL